MKKTLYLPISTLIIIIGLTTFASGFHIIREFFEVKGKSATVKTLTTNEVLNTNTSKIKVPSPAPSPSPTSTPSSVPAPAPSTLLPHSSMYTSTLINNESKISLQPEQSRIDYLNNNSSISTTNNNSSISTTDNLTKISNDVQPVNQNLYDKAVDFFAS